MASSDMDDWKVEMSELDAVLAALAEEDWRQVTPFKRWSVFDHVHHLNLADLVATTSAADPDRFRAEMPTSPMALSGDGLGPGGAPDIPPSALLARWREGVAALGDALAPLDPKTRLPWYGPDMGLRAFIAARQMETWAHGQTIHDSIGLQRTATDRLKPICELGWRTLGWSFHVRGLAPPAASVALQLTSPSGQLWMWGVETAAERISGPAEDFALVVCQCRNIRDTGLDVQGAVAEKWMSIAQCFAGGPADPPPPGARAPKPPRSDPSV
jgi:uncharacterized protein (TIGR03084 family)